MDLALNNPERLICHKTQQTKQNQTKIRIPKEPEPIYQYFPNRTILIILNKEGWPKRHFILCQLLILSGSRFINKMSFGPTFFSENYPNGNFTKLFA